MKERITMKKILCLALAIMCVFTFLTSCAFSAASNVNHNLNVAADNFEVLRKITVYNARTDLIIMEMEGYMSLSNNSTNELVVTCMTGPNQYKKNYVYLNEYVIYVVEDMDSIGTDPYHYKIKFYTAVPDVDINN
jgi:hypothetical protein